MAEYLRDLFARTVAIGSWGTADVGGAWSHDVTGSNLQVNGTNGQINIFASAAGRADSRLAAATAARDVAGAVSIVTHPTNWTTDVVATLYLRVATASTLPLPTGYYARATFVTGGSIVLATGYATAGTETQIATVTYPAGSWAGNQTWLLEAQAIGGSPSKVQARIYRPAAGIPTGSQGWLLVADDTGPQVAGVYQLRFTRALIATSTTPQAADIFASDPPVPDFTYSATALSATFATTGTTGDFTSYAWDWGDGTAAGSGATPSHTYATGGTYLVTLTGTTRWGSTFSTQGSVSVAAPLPAPPELLPSVKINGVEVCDDVYSVTWNLGRDSWWQPLTGQTASIRLRGIFTTAPGEPVAISVPNAVSGTPLWVGKVDQVTEVNEPVDARDETLVTAMDTASYLARQHLDRGTILGSKILPERLEDLRPKTSIKYRYRYSAAVAGGRWLMLKLKVKADKLGQKTYLEMVSDAMIGSLAFAYTARDGAISYAPIEAPAGLPSTPRIDLNTGIDCASRVTLDRNNLDGMINRWTVSDTDPSGDAEYDRQKRDSIDTFGERSYTVPAGTLLDPDNFPNTFARFDPYMIDALDDPIRGAEVEVPVIDWAQKVITASPLDFATWNAKVYSIVGVRHEVTVGDAWRCTLKLDRNPWEMDGRAVP